MMSTTNPSSSFFFLALALLALAARSDAAPSPPAAAAANGPVVLELFTSQGCSSCPPADQLLSKLGSDPKLAGRVIPLAFHVDYWDYIGWHDPFDAPRWSQRQQAYARAFHSNRIYTPQVVVDGHSECVGSEEGEVLRRVRDALAAPPPGRVTVALDPVTPDGHLRVRVGAKVAKTVAQGELDLWVAVWETGLVTPVGAGENASRTLRNDFVVRRLEKALALPGTAGAEHSGEIVLGIDKRWKTSALGVAAFLQDPATLQIYGAASQAVR
ncbi:MAG TPA: DUF1223 domain-containing protein [Thermoanaerobaculia bacterium]|jgi:hypothetical protein|nr:DUF1223 domain-containing protein [Thermoanaerobaculia bacterium]